MANDIRYTREKTSQNAFSPKDLTREAKEYATFHNVRYLHWFVVPTEHGMKLVVGIMDKKTKEIGTIDILF